MWESFTAIAEAYVAGESEVESELHQLVKRLFAQVLEVTLAKFVKRAFVVKADPVIDTSSEAEPLCLKNSLLHLYQFEPEGWGHFAGGLHLLDRKVR